MKAYLKLSVIITGLLGFALIPAHAFEGTIRLKMSNAESKEQHLAYSIKGSQVRTDIEVSKGMTATAIMDLSKDEAIMLIPNQRMYMTMSLKSTVEKATGTDPDDVELVNTGITEKILGYTCTKYLAKSKGQVTEIWATDELGTFMGLGSGMMGGKKAPKPKWEKTMTGKNFFPLRVVSDAKGKERFTMETTAIEPKSLPASFFLPPEGYQKFDLGGMMKGMGGANPFGG